MGWEYRRGVYFILDSKASCQHKTLEFDPICGSEEDMAAWRTYFALNQWFVFSIFGGGELKKH